MLDMTPCALPVPHQMNLQRPPEFHHKDPYFGAKYEFTTVMNVNPEFVWRLLHRDAMLSGLLMNFVKNNPAPEPARSSARVTTGCVAPKPFYDGLFTSYLHRQTPRRTLSTRTRKKESEREIRICQISEGAVPPGISRPTLARLLPDPRLMTSTTISAGGISDPIDEWFAIDHL